MSDPDRFDERFAPLMDEMRRESRRCPDTTTLLDYCDGRLAAPEAERVLAHLRFCADCAGELDLAGAEPEDVDDVHWRRAATRLDRRPVPWRPGAAPSRTAWPSSSSLDRRLLGAAAAALLAILGGLAIWSGRTGAPTEERVSTVRGAGIVGLSPAGEVEEWEAFSWSLDAPLEVRWEVEVERVDSGEPVWSGELASGDLAAAARRRIEPGQPHRWRVLARADSGGIVAQSGWTSFLLLAASPAATADEEDRRREQQ